MTEYVDNANVKIQPSVLFLIHILAAFLLNWVILLPFMSSKFLEWTAYLIVFVGLGLAFSAMRSFKKTKTTLDPHSSVSALVINGPYRFSRNPIYLGYVLLLIGLPLTLGIFWGMVLSPLLMTLLYQLVIKHEEVYLEEKFKDVYTSYKSRVRRWL